MTECKNTWKEIPKGLQGLSPYHPLECLLQAWLWVDDGDTEASRTWWTSMQGVLELLATKPGEAPHA